MLVMDQPAREELPGLTIVLPVWKTTVDEDTAKHLDLELVQIRLSKHFYKCGAFQQVAPSLG